MSAVRDRSFHLDAVRAASIALVFLSHILFFWPGFMSTVFTYAGLLGVELFFSLSGFLIGGILLDVERRGATPGAVRNFWLRRWLRTLPAYYVFLTLIAVTTARPEAYSFFFAQHWAEGGKGMLAVSWSLALEEAFYLTFPLLMLLVRPLARRFGMGAVALSALCLIIACPILRALCAGAGIDAQDPTYHSHPLLRLDCCAYGVLAACVRHRRLPRHFPAFAMGFFILAIGFSLLLWLSAFEGGEAWAPIRQLWGRTLWANFYSTIAIPAALLVLALADRGGPASHPSARVVTWISRTSYSFYLVHLPIIFWVADHVDAGHGPWIRAGLATVLALAGTAILHYGVERPFLLWRDRLQPAPGIGAKAAAELPL